MSQAKGVECPVCLARGRHFEFIHRSNTRSLRTPHGMGARRASRPQPSRGYCDDGQEINFVARDVIDSEIDSRLLKD